MNESLQTLASPVVLLIGATMFVILFTVILTTLGRAEVFPDVVNVTLAICASLLAVTGILRTFGHAEQTARNPGTSWVDPLLLPYTAMSIAMLLVLLLLIVRKVVSGRDRTSGAPKQHIRRESPDHPATVDGPRERNRTV